MKLTNAVKSKNITQRDSENWKSPHEYNDANMFHFRDEKGNEADAIVEFPDGTWGAFEIKLGANQIEAAAEELLKLKSIMEREGDNPPKVLCVICGMSNMAYKRPDGVYVVPITALKP